jgi:Ser/Thr protein kinase RdoA (MazF antagonist)
MNTGKAVYKIKMNTPDSVLQFYGYNKKDVSVTAFGTGLINSTWLVEKAGERFILQRVNTNVFKDPEAIDSNIRRIGDYLSVHHPGYLFVAPVLTKNGTGLVHTEEGYFRMFPFVKGSHAKDVLQHADQAFEAARQFGRFTKLLAGFDAGSLKETIPSFHDIILRYTQFEDALQNGNAERIASSQEIITRLKQNRQIADRFLEIKKDPLFKIRVTHHDTKISNVLFDAQDKALCVIDLDTVMPGYFISDIGDMMRTYLPTVSEEETDFTKIDVRVDIYHAIVKGYLSEMEEELTVPEKKSFFYAAQFLIYMQALRFITDHLNNDRYYGARYTGHNYNRAMNQLVLLERLHEKEKQLTTDNY